MKCQCPSGPLSSWPPEAQLVTLRAERFEGLRGGRGRSWASSGRNFTLFFPGPCLCTDSQSSSPRRVMVPTGSNQGGMWQCQRLSENEPANWIKVRNLFGWPQNPCSHLSLWKWIWLLSLGNNATSWDRNPGGKGWSMPENVLRGLRVPPGHRESSPFDPSFAGKLPRPKHLDYCVASWELWAWHVPLLVCVGDNGPPFQLPSAIVFSAAEQGCVLQRESLQLLKCPCSGHCLQPVSIVTGCQLRAPLNPKHPKQCRLLASANPLLWQKTCSLPCKKASLWKLQIHMKSDPITLKKSALSLSQCFPPESWRRDKYRLQLCHWCWPHIRKRQESGLWLRRWVSNPQSFARGSPGLYSISLPGLVGRTRWGEDNLGLLVVSARWGRRGAGGLAREAGVEQRFLERRAIS